jgi:hypothetical protein
MSFVFVVVVDHAQLSPDSSIICCVNSCCYHYVNFSLRMNLSSFVLSGCQSIMIFLCVLVVIYYFIFFTIGLSILIPFLQYFFTYLHLMLSILCFKKALNV